MDSLKSANALTTIFRTTNIQNFSLRTQGLTFEFYWTGDEDERAHSIEMPKRLFRYYFELNCIEIHEDNVQQ